MLSALLLALREGVEAALVVGIVLVYLNRTGRRQLARYVWAGVTAAIACSFAAAALVVSMIIWMNRIARRLRKEIEQRVETYAQKGERAAGWGIGFFVFLMVLREGATLDVPANAAEKRLREHEYRRRRGWSFAAAFLCLAVILSLTAEFVYTRASAAPPEAEHVAAIGKIVRIPLAEMSGVSVHFYSVDVQGTAFRFFVMRKPNGDYVTALDACQICGTIGYRQEGSVLICRNCGAPVNAAEIGMPGGCNPIAFKSHVEGSNIVVDLSAITDAASEIQK
jgi:hypothetical protein